MESYIEVVTEVELDEVVAHYMKHYDEMNKFEIREKLFEMDAEEKVNYLDQYYTGTKYELEVAK